MEQQVIIFFGPHESSGLRSAFLAGPATWNWEGRYRSACKAFELNRIPVEDHERSAITLGRCNARHLRLVVRTDF